MSAGLRGDPPTGERAGDGRRPVGGEEKTRDAGGLRGKTEAAGGKRGLDLDLGEASGERAAFQAFFQGPGALLRRVRFDNEKACGVETGAQQARPVRTAPFPAYGPRQAPQHQPATICQSFGDHRQDEAEPRGRVAIGVRLNLVKPALEQRGEGRLGAGFMTPTRCCTVCSTDLPLAGGGTIDLGVGS